MKKAEFDFIVRHQTEQIVQFLIEDYKLSIPEAFDRVYSSALYADLRNPKTGLYRYSPAYLYERMEG